MSGNCTPKTLLLALATVVLGLVPSGYADCEGDPPYTCDPPDDVCQCVVGGSCSTGNGQEFEYNGKMICGPPCDELGTQTFESFQTFVCLEYCCDEDCLPDGVGPVSAAMFCAWKESCGEAPPGICEELDPPGGGGAKDGEGNTIGDCPEDSNGGGTPKGDTTDNPVSGQTVDLVDGDKMEFVNDLRVRLNGRDFTVGRSYRSSPAVDSGPMSGERWMLTPFHRLDVQGGFVCNTGPGLITKVCFSEPYSFDSNGDPKTSPGPATQYLKKSSVVIDSKEYPVWRLIEPGQWEMDFYRKKDMGEPPTWEVTPDHLEGLLRQARDMYGAAGNFQTYEYVSFGTMNPAARLHKIYLNGEGGTTVAEAEIWFHWNLGVTNKGRLASMEVVRYDGSPTPQQVLTQRIEYTYMDPGFPVDLGTDGDLVQVVKYERVDPQLPAGGEAWRVLITQYRYHNQAGAGSPGVPLRNFTWQGQDHQLKMVILPEQIEYYAQKINAAAPTPVLPNDAANDLLALADVATVFTDGQDVLVVDLAAKVIEQYASGKVQTQFIQSACGCAGAGTQGLRLTYEYFSYQTPPRWTTKIGEEKFEGGSWQAHRSLHYDMEGQGSDEIPYLVTKAIIEDDNPNDKMWVTHYQYDTNRNLSSTFTPSAMASYTPGTAASPPSYTSDNNNGLVYLYTYTADNRPATISVKQGLTGPSIMISRTTFGDGTGDERLYLPKKIERFRTTTPSPPPDDVEVEEYLYAFYSTGGGDVSWVQRKVEAELAKENGPGGNYLSHEFFDTRGLNHWSHSADESLTRREFDDRTGSVTLVERNAAPGGNFPPGPPTVTFLGRNGDGGSLTHDYELDILGRVRERITPGLVSTYTTREMRAFPDRPGLLYYAEVTLPHEFLEGGQMVFNGPATIAWYNADDDTVGLRDYEPTVLTIDSSGSEVGYFLKVTDYVLNQLDELARSVIEHDVSGLVTASKVWHDALATGEPEDSSRLHLTTLSYDALGRVQDTTNPVGTITHNEYDVFDRVIRVRVGTTQANLKTVARYFYDSGGSPIQGAGNGNLTFVRQHVAGGGARNRRDTINSYDFRDRLVTVKNPIAPHELVEYDNLDRVIKRALFSSETPPPDIDTTTGRERYLETAYSQRGLVFRQRLAIDPTLGTLTFIETHTWYDEVGRAVETWAPNGPATKTTYDGLGRRVTVYTTDRGGDGDPDPLNPPPGIYTDVYDEAAHAAVVTGDIVLEQMDYGYITGLLPAAHVGMLELATTRRRTHDATKTGDLGDFTGPDEKLLITTFTGMFYDGADREIRTVNYGTNKNEFAFFVSGTDAVPDPDQDMPPGPNDPPGPWNVTGGELVTGTTYDLRGLVETSIDPEYKITKFLYDDLNRRIAVIENHVDGDVSWDELLVPPRWVGSGVADGPDGDDDRITSFVYDGISNVIVQVGHTGTNDQVTEYDYGVDTNAAGNPLASDIFSNDLLGNVVYPDEGGAGGASVADRTVFYAYNRQGELITMEDQNDTRHAYQRDLLGRVVLDEVIDFVDPLIDQAITEIGTTYDGAGRVESVTSSNSSQQVVNEVEFGYNRLWQILDVWQDPDGPVDAGSLRVTYTYGTESAPSGGNFSRPIKLTYPDGKVVDYGYGNAGATDSRISRVRSLDDLLSGVTFAAYEYIGLDMFAVADYAEPDVQLDRTASHTGERQTAGHFENPGKYPGFDRFGRVVADLWVDGAFTTGPGHPNVPPIVEFTYAYDEASNRLKRDNETATIKFGFRHETFVYDGLDRLSESIRGATSQRWSLDILGNWDEVATDPDVDGIYQTLEPRTHNGVNELTIRDPDGGGMSPPLDLTYDDAGNLRDEEVISGSINMIYKHDAWNRLRRVEIDDGGGPEPRGEYAYNGLNWRIIKRSDSDLVDSINVLDQQRLMYYSPNWQLLEERIDDDLQSGTIDRHVQYVWGQRYIDDIVLHRQGGAAYYHMTDVQFSTVAIIDENAVLVERISYNAYGNARHHRRADLDGDGQVAVPDELALLANWGLYGVGDLDRSGTVAVPDLLALLAQWGPGEPSGQLSSSTVDNQIGYDGYVFNVETQQYHVRNRCYDPVLGRWLERDPLSYADGSNLYEYVASSPVSAADAEGTSRSGPPGAGGGTGGGGKPCKKKKDCCKQCKDWKSGAVYWKPVSSTWIPMPPRIPLPAICRCAWQRCQQHTRTCNAAGRAAGCRTGAPLRTIGGTVVETCSFWSYSVEYTWSKVTMTCAQVCKAAGAPGPGKKGFWFNTNPGKPSCKK